MRKIGMFEAKTHLPEVIKSLEVEGVICLTNRNKEVAYIISADQYHRRKQGDAYKRLKAMLKKHPLGTLEEIREMRDEGRK